MKLKSEVSLLRAKAASAAERSTSLRPKPLLLVTVEILNPRTGIENDDAFFGRDLFGSEKFP